MQRSALCRSRQELSNAYLLTKFGFDTGSRTSPVNVFPDPSTSAARTLSKRTEYPTAPPRRTSISSATRVATDIAATWEIWNYNAMGGGVIFETSNLTTVLFCPSTANRTHQKCVHALEMSAKYTDLQQHVRIARNSGQIPQHVRRKVNDFVWNSLT